MKDFVTEGLVLRHFKSFYTSYTWKSECRREVELEYNVSNYKRENNYKFRLRFPKMSR